MISCTLELMTTPLVHETSFSTGSLEGWGMSGIIESVKPWLAFSCMIQGQIMSCHSTRAKLCISLRPCLIYLRAEQHYKKVLSTKSTLVTRSVTTWFLLTLAAIVIPTSSASSSNRPVALRGHVTNASLKRWVGILLMPKIDRAHKNYFTPKIWEEKHLREIFYGTLIFQQSTMICIGRHVGGHTLALQHGGQNYFLLVSC